MRILVTGGGTGGHVFPLLAVIQELRKRKPSSSFHWFGSRRLEWQVVPEADIGGTFIPFTFSYRKMSVSSFGYYLRTLPMWLTGYPIRCALNLIETFQPDLILASGGYVSVPGLSSAVIKAVPYALLEVNSVPGRANRMFASSASRIYCSTEESAEQLANLARPGSVRVVGYPARSFDSFDAREYFRVPKDVPLVIVSGGSMGAEHINRVMLRVAEDPDFLSEFGDAVAIVHQWGRVPEEREYARFVTLKHYRAISFDPYLPALFKDAKLFVGRAGASAICDLAGAKLPALLIPYPHHADRHQFKNAKALLNVGCAMMVEEAKFMPDTFVPLLREFVLGGRAEEMRKGYDRIPADGAGVIASDLIQLLESVA